MSILCLPFSFSFISSRFEHPDTLGGALGVKVEFAPPPLPPPSPSVPPPLPESVTGLLEHEKRDDARLPVERGDDEEQQVDTTMDEEFLETRSRKR